MPTNTLNPTKIHKSLPKGFIGVEVPTYSRIVWIRADLKEISLKDAKKAIAKLCKELKLTVEDHVADEETADWKLYDKELEKQMLIDAKACLKVVKDFYSKYQRSYRYFTNASQVVNNIARIVNNDE